MKNEYRREAAADGLFAFMADFQAEMLMLQADKQLLLRTNADERMEILDELLGEAGARRLPDEEYAGRACEVARDADGLPVSRRPGSRSGWTRKQACCADRERAGPGRRAGRGNGGRRTEVARALRDVKIVYAVLEQRVNEPIPDRPSPSCRRRGPRKTSSRPREQPRKSRRPDRKIQKAAGLDRFALSGQAAPDFELPLLAADVQAVRAEGQGGGHRFRATWCGPCVRALPEMKKLAEPTRRIRRSSWSVQHRRGENRDQVEKLVAKNKLAYPIGLGPAERRRRSRSAAFRASSWSARRRRAVPAGRVLPEAGERPEAGGGRAAGGRNAGSAAPYTAEELKASKTACAPSAASGTGPAVPVPGDEAGRKGVQAALEPRGAIRRRAAQRAHGHGARRPAIPPRTFLRWTARRPWWWTRPPARSRRRWTCRRICAPRTNRANSGNGPVRTPEGDSLVGYQEFYTVTKKARARATAIGNGLFGMRLPAGEPWRKNLGENESLRGLTRAALGHGRPARGGDWGELRFLDATGATTLKQNLDYQTQATFALDAAASRFCTVGNKTSCTISSGRRKPSPPRRRRRPRKNRRPANRASGQPQRRSQSRKSRGKGAVAHTGLPWRDGRSAARGMQHLAGHFGKIAAAGVEILPSPSTGWPR